MKFLLALCIALLHGLPGNVRAQTTLPAAPASTTVGPPAGTLSFYNRPLITILGGTTKNYSRTVQGGGYVVDTTVTIGYDTPWRQVHAMLIDAALRTEGILSSPAPQVFQTALSDWYPVYRLVCHAAPEEPRPRALVLSALHANIQDVFNTFGVQIMSPQYMADPAQAKVVPPHAWAPAPAQAAAVHTESRGQP